MNPIHISYKIEFKHWYSYIIIDIQDLLSPDAEDAIVFQPSTQVSTQYPEIYKLGLDEGDNETMDIGPVTCYQIGFRGPLQVVRAIELILKQDYFSKEIPDHTGLIKQLAAYQVHVKNKALKTIHDAMHTIFTYPFDGLALDPVPARKRVPFAINEVYKLLKQARATPIESFKRLAWDIEMQLSTAKQKGNPSSFFSLKMPVIYRELIEAFKLSPLLPITSENRNYAIASSLNLPKPILELVSDYAMRDEFGL